MLGPEKRLHRRLLSKWMKGCLSPHLSFLPGSWEIEVPTVCHILFQELEIQQHRQKVSGLMERQYILVGVGGTKQDKILINYMLYDKVIGTLRKQEKADCSVRLGTG